MRIAVATWNCRQVGGVEAYLGVVLPALLECGNQVAIIYETEAPNDRAMIELPPKTPMWSSAQLSRASILGKLRQWDADVVFCHGLRDVGLEWVIAQQAPSVFYAHNYYGCCISGAKSFGVAHSRPCDRRFGAACLLQFYPRRCGGLNPITMARLYRRESRHLKLLPSYSAIVTASEHMRREFLRQGFDQGMVRTISPPIGSSDQFRSADGLQRSRNDRDTKHGWTLLFMGRMTRIKGGDVLLDALVELGAKLSPPPRLIFAGDGPARARWEKRAARVESQVPGVTIEFRGWLSGSAYQATLAEADLLVMPSLWPEPFGRAGLEAGQHGIPSAAFAVGGIPEWLCDGLNGHLAPGNPPTASGLADAIWRCIGNREHHARLCDGARKQAARFNVAQHTERLCALFDEITTR
jgi:glycosyltransferase involved in cell wall biosynthesis